MRENECGETVLIDYLLYGEKVLLASILHEEEFSREPYLIRLATHVVRGLVSQITHHLSIFKRPNPQLRGSTVAGRQKLPIQ